MRRSRKISLNVTGLFHKMWRGHNREHIFADNEDKNDYLKNLGLKRNELTELLVHWYSFCLMGTHTHETGGVKTEPEKNSFTAGIEELGNWMRRAHSCFGAGYNQRHNRQGKVAYDRPKTCEIENGFHLLRVMFYGDANPVRAGMVSHPSRYAYSSYNYYAHGKKSELTEHLTFPEAYLALGETPEERQAMYRRLCDQYLRDSGLLDDAPAIAIEMEALFIGNSVWRQLRQSKVRESLKARAGPP